ncbi:MAG: metallophosphoesterase family protein [Asticcacaulis sp.]
MRPYRNAGAMGVAASLGGLLLATTLLVTPLQATEWRLEPAYDLPRAAAVRPKAAKPVPGLSVPLSPALRLADLEATHSQVLSERAPQGDFTAELWVLDHVNQPVGALLSVGQTRLGYYDGQVVAGQGLSLSHTDRQKFGYLERWHHLVLVRETLKTTKQKGQVRLTVYHNGAPMASETVPAIKAKGPIRLDSYLGREPYMIPANLVNLAAVESSAFTPQDVAARFKARHTLVDEGRLYADRLHFTQPPYLNLPRADGIELSFEFDRPLGAEVWVGESAETLKPVPVAPGARRAHGLTLSGLKPDTPYVYRVRSTKTGETAASLDSGLLSFRTAPLPGRPFVMVISGDTEARPHINHRMSELMWEERPALLAIMGDLTDGGSTPKRFEWTHEYFTGMGAFFGRVPTLGVVGNGEEELDWYHHYHRQNLKRDAVTGAESKGRETYFSHVYGDVEFFVLDANLERREREFPGFRARQKAWLDAALSASKARWKIAMHHQDVRTSDSDDYGDSFKGKSGEGDTDVQADFQPLYDKHKIDLVFFGHLHSYERSWPIRDGKVNLSDGTTYVQVGGLGGNLEDFAPNKPWFSAKTVRAHHYVTLHVTPETLEARMVDAEGRLRDVFTVHQRTKAVSHNGVRQESVMR